MEYTQWENVEIKLKIEKSLNPCCNGIYSMSCPFLNLGL